MNNSAKRFRLSLFNRCLNGAGLLYSLSGKVVVFGL